MKLALILWLVHVLPQQAADPMCLATTVYLEARGQPELGQRAIAEVALRRRDTGAWGGSAGVARRWGDDRELTTAIPQPLAAVGIYFHGLFARRGHNDIEVDPDLASRPRDDR